MSVKGAEMRAGMTEWSTGLAGQTDVHGLREGRREARVMQNATDGNRPGRVRCEGRRGGKLPRVWAATAAETAPARTALAEAEFGFYRKYTEAVLRRYQRLTMQAGQVPSRMDREMFRGKMSHYKVAGFDDRVIFCVDVERCLRRLNAGDERLVRRITMQGYSMGEAAATLGMSLRSCVRLYWRAVDRMTQMFLTAGLLMHFEDVSRGESARR
jgi:hypothetical protein